MRLYFLFFCLHIACSDAAVSILGGASVASVTTFAGQATSGSTDGVGTNAQFSTIYGMTVDSSNNLFVCDNTNCLIRKITSAGTVTTWAGGGGGTTCGYTAGTGTAATFNNPSGLVVDTTGIIYVADFANNLIRKIGAGGAVTTFAGGGSATGTTCGSASGTATAATFCNPAAIAIDTSAGNLYVVDSFFCLIRKIVISTKVVSTIAGTPSVCTTTDGVGTSARFNYPKGIFIDSTFSNLYISEKDTIRKLVISTSTVSTVLSPGYGFTYSVYLDSNNRYYFTNGWAAVYYKTSDAAPIVYVAGNGAHIAFLLIVSLCVVLTTNCRFNNWLQ